MTIQEAKKNITTYVMAYCEKIPYQVIQALDVARECMDRCEEMDKAEEQK